MKYVLTLALIAAFALAGCAETEKAAVQVNGETTTEATTVSTPDTTEAPEEPNPDGESELSCDYDLGDFDESGDPEAGYRFLAGGTLTNTGNIGIVARVTYRWELAGQPDLKVKKFYRVRTGETREVDVSIPTDNSGIDAHQSADGDCKATVSIVDTFGSVE